MVFIFCSVSLETRVSTHTRSPAQHKSIKRFLLVSQSSLTFAVASSDFFTSRCALPKSVADKLLCSVHPPSIYFLVLLRFTARAYSPSSPCLNRPIYQHLVVPAALPQKTTTTPTSQSTGRLRAHQNRPYKRLPYLTPDTTLERHIVFSTLFTAIRNCYTQQC